jgi:hypothetical protein
MRRWLVPISLIAIAIASPSFAATPSVSANTNVLTTGNATAQKFGFSQVTSSGMAMSNSFATSNANSKTVRTNTSENTSNFGHAIGNATFKGTVNAFAAANGGWMQ